MRSDASTVAALALRGRGVNPRQTRPFFLRRHPANRTCLSPCAFRRYRSGKRAFLVFPSSFADYLNEQLSVPRRVKLTEIDALPCPEQEASVTDDNAYT